MKHYITAIAMALLCVFTAAASSAEFKRIWVETNAPHDGEKGVMIHADFDLKGVKDKGVQCQAIFYAVPGKRALHDINGRYRLSPSLNYIASYSYFKAKKNDMDVEDCTIFIPTEELHLKNPRKYRIFVKVSVFANPGKDGEFLAESDYIPFIVDMTDLNGGAKRFDYDPSNPVKIEPSKPGAQPGVQPAAPAEDKFVPSIGEPERDKKGRPKRKKAKVFIS